METFRHSTRLDRDLCLTTGGREQDHRTRPNREAALLLPVGIDVYDESRLHRMSCHHPSLDAPLGHLQEGDIRSDDDFWGFDHCTLDCGAYIAGY